MKILVWSVAVSVFVLSGTSILWAAQDTACLDQAQTQQEIDRCLDQTYTPLVEQIDGEFERLVEKFKADQDISEALRLTKRAWQNYHTSECVLEGLVADYPTEQKNRKSRKRQTLKEASLFTAQRPPRGARFERLKNCTRSW